MKVQHCVTLYYNAINPWFPDGASGNLPHCKVVYAFPGLANNETVCYRTQLFLLFIVMMLFRNSFRLKTMRLFEEARMSHDIGSEFLLLHFIEG